MGLTHSPKIVTDGLMMYTDMSNLEKSFRGVATTNIHDNSMSIYNNGGADVNVTLAATSETYRGATVWRMTLTPTTATGVGYLTAGANPGIGLVTNGGGGLAARYTGHAIFYKSTVPMHSTPLFSNYSNIGGWGAGPLGSDRSVSMGDGWSRGEVIWYDTVTRTDGKYWAINPLAATLNVPIVILWAGPFKEDRNDSTHVAPYTMGTRTSAQTLLDMTGRNTITATSLTYAADRTYSFNGTSDYMRPTITHSYLSPSCIEVVFRKNAVSGRKYLVGYRHNPGYSLPTIGSMYFVDNALKASVITVAEVYRELTSSITIAANQYYHVCFNKDTTNGLMEIFVNGVSGGTLSFDPTTFGQYSSPGAFIGNNELDIGKSSNDNAPQGWGTDFFDGVMPITKVYNRVLTAAEVQQNFNSARIRYGL